MARETTDYLIAGAGCAGLSLAVHLVEAGVRGRILLVDSRTEFARDRTWCGWNVRSHPFAGAVTRSWDRWRVVGAAGDVHEAGGSFRYEHIPADRFYALARHRLAAASNVELRLGTPLGAIRSTPEGVEADGLAARLAFDSRPAPRKDAPGGAPLEQRFVGRFVAAPDDVFDAGTVDLMDFRIEIGGVGFGYVLPFDARHALVEATRVGPPGGDGEALGAAADAYLAARWPGVAFSVEGEERGTIPMVPHGATGFAKGSRVLPIGLAAGAAKPSTGYAFGAIQRASAALAGAVTRFEAGGPPPTAFRYRACRSEWLDALFLRALTARPEAASGWFARLFERVPPDALVRFLTDEGGVADDLRVVAALPKLAFLQALLASPQRAAPPRGFAVR